MTRFFTARGPNQGAVDEQPQEVLQPGHVRVAVAFCGLCRSDSVAIREFEEGSSSRFGHEAAGIVLEAGPDAPTASGTRVVAMAGDAYATDIQVRYDRLIAVPDEVSLAEACLAEPLSCILSGLDQLDLRFAEQVYIVGSGFMGSLAVAALASRGYEVIVIEPRRAARELAARLGAAEILDPDDAEGLAGSVEVVLECSGSQSGLDLAGSIAGIDAQLSIVGYHQSFGGQRNVDMKAWNYKCLRVINAHTRSEDRISTLLRRALRMMASGAIRPADLVTATIALDQLPAWLANGGEEDPAAIKTVVECSDASDVQASTSTRTEVQAQ